MSNKAVLLAIAVIAVFTLMGVTDLAHGHQSDRVYHRAPCEYWANLRALLAALPDSDRWAGAIHHGVPGGHLAIR